MSSSPKIYLAGGMESAGEAGEVWRSEITPHLESLGYSVWNPYEKEFNVGIDPKELFKLKHVDYDKYLSFCRKIVQFDISELVECDAVAVKIDRAMLAGAGTQGELTVCRLYDIPVFAWIDLPNGKFGVPSWVMGCLSTFSYYKDDFYASIPPASHRKMSETGSKLKLDVERWAEEKGIKLIRE